MAHRYTQINGQRVEVTVAAAFKKLAAAFKKRFRLTLRVRSGVRTRAEQLHFYNLYLRGRGNLALHPDSPRAYHVESNPRGPRALDIEDSGTDKGVQHPGTVRSSWIKANASRYGFDPAGFRFSQVEPWHIEYTRPFSKMKQALAVAKKAVQKITIRPSTMLKWRWTGIQRMLKAHYGYAGAIDNDPGSGTISAFQRFMNRKGYGSLKVTGKWNASTVRAAQRWLKGRWRYTGDIDAIPGSGTKGAWHRAEAANGLAYKKVE